MRPVTVATTGTLASPPIGMDYLADPFNVGIFCVVTGTVVYTVEHSGEQPPVNWFPNANIAGAAANASTNYMFPVRYVRLNQASGSGTVTMTVLQGSNGG